MQPHLHLGLLSLAALVAAATMGCGRSPSGSETGPARVVTTVKTDPKSFNRLASPDPAGNLAAWLTQATLLRVNRATGDLEPRLAREWSVAPDGRTYTMKLRDDVTFSDGVPFTAADVLFTFQALYDPRVASPLASSFEIGGQPIVVAQIDDRTVTLTLPAPYGPGLSLLDSLPILPRHKLKDALDTGRFGGAWNVKTPPAELAGAGPFVLAEYVPGLRLRFTKNPRFWRRPLPHLDEIEIQVVPDLNSELLRLESGQSDLLYDFARAEDLATLREAAARGVVRLIDAGVDIAPEALWFNLTPGAPNVKDRPWLQREEFRKAVSHAVDRQAIVDTVYLGAAVPVYGPITPGHGEWYAADLPAAPHDPAQAKALLASIGLTDRNGDGSVEDARGRPARFSIVTVKGNSIRERTVSMLQNQLARVGLAVDVVPEDLGSLIRRFGDHDFDAVYYAVKSDAFDPGRNLDFWLSSGFFHLWNSQQPKPATSWEARIDALMRTQSTTLDRAERRRLFREVQAIFLEHAPALYFAAAKTTVATSARLAGVTPSVLQPPVLWNAEALSITERR